jgi:hypothetical protein
VWCAYKTPAEMIETSPNPSTFIIQPPSLHMLSSTALEDSIVEIKPRNDAALSSTSIAINTSSQIQQQPGNTAPFWPNVYDYFPRKLSPWALFQHETYGEFDARFSYKTHPSAVSSSGNHQGKPSPPMSMVTASDPIHYSKNTASNPTTLRLEQAKSDPTTLGMSSQPTTTHPKAPLPDKFKEHRLTSEENDAFWDVDYTKVMTHLHSHRHDYLMFPQVRSYSSLKTYQQINTMLEIERTLKIEEGASGKICDFVRKLYYMLTEDLHSHEVICWTHKGDSFFIKDVNEFAKIKLPKYFGHNNFSSFVRQLNKYDFHKVHSLEVDRKYGNAAWEFRHFKFRRGRLDLLVHIKRKDSAAAAATPLSKTPVEEHEFSKLPSPPAKRIKNFHIPELKTTVSMTEDITLTRMTEDFKTLSRTIHELVQLQGSITTNLQNLTKDYQNMMKDIQSIKKAMNHELSHDKSTIIIDKDQI